MSSRPIPPKARPEQFKKLAEQKTQGAVRVEVYHNSMLYKDKEEIEALQMGAVQMLAPTPGKFGPMGVKEFEALDLPFLFDNFEEEMKVTTGPIGKQLLQKLETKGVLGLSFWNNGFKQMASNKPIRKVEDFKGQKSRIDVVQGGRVPDAIRWSDVAGDGLRRVRTPPCRPASSTVRKIRPTSSIPRRCTRHRST